MFLRYLTFSPKRSVGENEFCGNEVEAKLIAIFVKKL